MLVKKLLDRTEALAHKACSTNYKVAAIIAKGSYIIATGQNMPLNGKPRPNGPRSIHAEIRALSKRRSSTDNSDCVIYVVVLTQRAHAGFSRPCELCLPHIEAAGIKTIVYSNRGCITIERYINNKWVVCDN